MVWVIAFTLSAYWLREILSMYFCYQLVTPITKNLILISCGYHSFKIVNVNIDAYRKWSPKIGILRLLLDYWHFDTVVNCIISFKRMFLQGFDTAVHGCIILDMLKFTPSSTVGLERLFADVTANNTILDSKSFVMMAAAIWFCHALVVQITRKSTATLMVELYRKFAVSLGLITKSECIETEMPTVKESTNRHSNSKSSVQTTLGTFLGPHMHSTHKSSNDCKVCRMLSKPDTCKMVTPVTPPSVVFLGHGAQLCSVFDFRFSHPDNYWRASWWMENPLVYLIVLFISGIWYPISVIYLGLSPVVIADRSLSPLSKVSSSPEASIAPAVVQLSNKPLHNNTDMMISEIWMVKCFGWQYMSSWSIWRNYAKSMVVRTVLQAEKVLNV
jgi:hypothetical protein